MILLIFPQQYGMKYGNGCYMLNTCAPTGVYPRFIKQAEYR